MKKIAIISHTERGNKIGLILKRELSKSILVSSIPGINEGVKQVDSTLVFVEKNFRLFDGFIFIGALGICVRTIAPHLKDKNTDPAIVNIDDLGLNVQSVLSGHKGQANDLSRKLASILGANPIISTSSDIQNIWALDLLASQFGWGLKTNRELNRIVSLFVNNKSTALLLEIEDKGTEFLVSSLPSFVKVYHNYEDIHIANYQLLIIVSFKKYATEIPSIFYIPKVLSIGSGCSKELDNLLFERELMNEFEKIGFYKEAISEFGTVDIKEKQSAYLKFCENNHLPFKTFEVDELNSIEVPTPSEKVLDKIGTKSVSEATAVLLSGNKDLLVPKTKVLISQHQKFTYSIGLKVGRFKKHDVAIVGAGPGDEQLLTIRGKLFLEKADCVLYAGSLIPEEMLIWCKEGTLIRNSAVLTLEEQISLIKEYYERGKRVVRLQCGDPSIYGAIQEQMSIMDKIKIPYFIVPGISSFSAAAAALKSEFTIPEEVQTIILTRGEGKTPLPPAENLEEMARHKATMCIFLSVGIAGKVQEQLLKHYCPETPVAVLYRLTWVDEEIYTGELKDLELMVKSSRKTRTVLIVVGKAIGARMNRSKLYNPEWKHIFRKTNVLSEN